MPKEDWASRKPRFLDDDPTTFEEEIISAAEQQAQVPYFDRDAANNVRVTINLGTQVEELTKTAERIFIGGTNDPGLLQEWTWLFMDKQRDYGDRADDLGVPGQYAELSRKMIKLRRVMWEGHPLVGEPPREVVLDLIGHLFLTLKLMEQQNFGGKAGMPGV